MTLQLVITRRSPESIRVLEMGLGADGMGETLREHDLRVSDPLCARYITDLLNTLQTPETAR